MSNLINSKAERDRITAEKQIKILSFLLGSVENYRELIKLAHN